MRERYFDGKNRDFPLKYRNPWNETLKINGTDAFSFKPFVTEKDELWFFLDDLYRTSKFVYWGQKRYFNKLDTTRYVY